MKVEFIDEKGNTYKTIHPPTNEVVIGIYIPTGMGGRDLDPNLMVEVAGDDPYYLPDDHKVRVAETVGQQPVES